MGALMGRIAREIGDRVEGAIALHELFHMPAADAAGLLSTSKALLEAWHTTYMQARLKGAVWGGVPATTRAVVTQAGPSWSLPGLQCRPWHSQRA